MKRLPVGVVAAAIGIATACAGASPPQDSVAGSTDIAAVMSDTATVGADSTPTAVPAPTPTAVPVFSDDDHIEAAVAGLERDGLEGLVAWDVVESRIANDGVVELRLCGWSGESAFDALYLSVWFTEVEDNAQLAAVESNTAMLAGECLNTELVETALAFVRAYDEFQAVTMADPANYDREASLALYTTNYHEGVTEYLTDIADDNITGIPPSVAPLPESAIAPIVWTRTRTDDGTTFELVACRDMNLDAGLYRDGVLLTDASSEKTNFHSIEQYVLVADPASALGWRISGQDGLSWGNCWYEGTFLEGVTSWKPEHRWNELS